MEEGTVQPSFPQWQAQKVIATYKSKRHKKGMCLDAFKPTKNECIYSNFVKWSIKMDLKKTQLMERELLRDSFLPWITSP